jgi:hypothetical protein
MTKSFQILRLLQVPTNAWYVVIVPESVDDAHVG